MVQFKLISAINWILPVSDAVGWVIWPVNVVPEMTYKVSSGMLSLYSLTHYWEIESNVRLCL